MRQEELKELLEQLMGLPAPCGYEEKVALVMRDLLADYTGQAEIDRAGNVMATLPGQDPKAPSLMIFAHMDQLGFMVRKIEPDGLIQLDRMGGIPEKVLPGLKISIRGIDGSYIPGVIGVKSHHQATQEEKYRVDPITNLFVDVGASSKEEVLERGIHVGCPAIYQPSVTSLSEHRVSGTAADNRGGCAVLAAVAQQLAGKSHRATIHLVGTVWEEFNIRGAVFAARKLKPDLAIGLDVVMSGDTPDLQGRYDLALGKGPAVGLYNFHGRGTLNGCIGHPGLYHLARQCAQREGMPLQEFASIGMLTDTAYVQMEGGYVGCLDMGFPARYTHTPIETVDIRDLKGLADLVTNMAVGLGPDFPIKRY